MKKKCIICEKEFIITSQHKRTKTIRVTCSRTCARTLRRVQEYCWHLTKTKERKK